MFDTLSNDRGAYRIEWVLVERDDDITRECFYWVLPCEHPSTSNACEVCKTTYNMLPPIQEVYKSISVSKICVQLSDGIQEPYQIRVNGIESKSYVDEEARLISFVLSDSTWSWHYTAEDIYYKLVERNQCYLKVDIKHYVKLMETPVNRLMKLL